jgi:hypothetical protein
MYSYLDSDLEGFLRTFSGAFTEVHYIRDMVSGGESISLRVNFLDRRSVSCTYEDEDIISLKEFLTLNLIDLPIKINPLSNISNASFLERDTANACIEQMIIKYRLENGL